ncbi:MAG: hypothetical protein ACXVIG_04425 [Halobacteriota archaeon]
MNETDDAQRIKELEKRVEDLEVDIGNLMMILRQDVIEGIAVALDDIQALLGILPHHVPSLADELQPIHDMNESARSVLRSSEVFEWEAPSEEELGKK